MIILIWFYTLRFEKNLFLSYNIMKIFIQSTPLYLLGLKLYNKKSLVFDLKAFKCFFTFQALWDATGPSPSTSQAAACF